MGDPLSAISLAANVLQFIDFACGLFSTAKQIYKDGNTAEISHLEDIAASLSKLAQDVKTSSESHKTMQGVNDENDLCKLAKGCQEVADELIKALRTLTPKSTGNRKWESLYHALKVIWKKEQIDSLHKRLTDIRAQMSARAIMFIK